MKCENVAPSYIYFLSGVAASAAVNLVTAVPTSGIQGWKALILSASATLWFACSFALAAAASLLEESRRRFERYQTSRLSESEVQQTWASVFDSVRSQVRFRVGTAIVYAVVGSATIWLAQNEYSENRCPDSPRDSQADWMNVSDGEPGGVP